MSTVEQQALNAMRLLDEERDLIKESSPQYPYPAERDIVIIWGIYRGWTARAIGSKTGLHKKTIKYRRNLLLSEPSRLFNLHRLMDKRIVRRSREPIYKCLFCHREMREITEKKAREHVAGHLLSADKIKELGVMEGYDGI